MAIRKRTNNDLQNITQKTKGRATRIIWLSILIGAIWWRLFVRIKLDIYDFFIIFFFLPCLQFINICISWLICMALFCILYHSYVKWSLLSVWCMYCKRTLYSLDCHWLNRVHAVNGSWKWTVKTSGTCLSFTCWKS